MEKQKARTRGTVAPAWKHQNQLPLPTRPVAHVVVGDKKHPTPRQFPPPSSIRPAEGLFSPASEANPVFSRSLTILRGGRRPHLHRRHAHHVRRKVEHVRVAVVTPRHDIPAVKQEERREPPAPPPPPAAAPRKRLQACAGRCAGANGGACTWLGGAAGFGWGAIGQIERRGFALLCSSINSATASRSSRGFFLVQIDIDGNARLGRAVYHRVGSVISQRPSTFKARARQSLHLGTKESSLPEKKRSDMHAQTWR